jgi:hypothetical protein
MGPEMTRATRRDPYSDHRLALSIIDSGFSGAGLEPALQDVEARGAEVFAFARFLAWHKLAPIWYHVLQLGGARQRVDPVFWAVLRDERHRVAATYLAQKAVLAEIDRRFGEAGIIYAAIKGVHIREVAYPDASLRSAADIDLLVAPPQRVSAASVLIDAGYSLTKNVENISHEATLSRGNIDIDLHWDVLRPGRMRCGIVEALLERRVRVGCVWGLDASDALFLILVHPAFAKYVNSPNASLSGVVDFMLLLGLPQIDWDFVAGRLDHAGVKTAAWTMLTWFMMVARPDSVTLPEGFIECLQPGTAQRKYLRQWLDKDLATRWLEHPLLVRAGLTLAMHDSPADAWRAIRGWMASRAARSSDPLLDLASNLN